MVQGGFPDGWEMETTVQVHGPLTASDVDGLCGLLSHQPTTLTFTSQYCVHALLHALHSHCLHHFSPLHTCVLSDGPSVFSGIDVVEVHAMALNKLQLTKHTAKKENW